MRKPSRETVAASARAKRRAGQTPRGILDAAIEIFAEKGFSGANVDEIASKAEITKPTLYYHYGSKEGLFAAVLEDVYAGMREIESSLDLTNQPPTQAMRQLVSVTFDYHARHPEWIRLISVANIHDAKHIAGSESLAPRNSQILEILRALLDRGVAAGVFRPGVDVLHLHLLINSYSFYRVSNRHTWKVIFNRDLQNPADVAAQRETIVEAVLAFLLRYPPEAIPAPSGAVLDRTHGSEITNLSASSERDASRISVVST